MVEPEVGELVTSLDMAGCSLTLVFLDDELERLLARTRGHPGLPQGPADQTAGRTASCGRTRRCTGTAESGRPSRSGAGAR